MIGDVAPEHPMASWLAPLLEAWANWMAARFCAPVFMVGSALVKPRPRDVDIRIVLTDEAFDQRYGIRHWTDIEIIGNETAPEVVRYFEDMAHMNALATKLHSRGLNFDIQVKPESSIVHHGQANKPRIRLDKLTQFRTEAP